LGPNFRIAHFGISDRGLKHNLYFPGFLKSLKASLYHIPLNSVAWAMPRPYVVTIHDLSSLLFPQQRDFRYKLHQLRYRRGVVRAARVIAVSHATRRDLQAVLRISDDRLSTIYSARFWIATRLPIPTSFTPEPFACTRTCRVWWRRSPYYVISWRITRYIRICAW